MQASGWGLTFMAAIIVAGAVVCRFRNDGAHSGRAAALSRASRVSFATLALIALAFAGTVLMGQQLWAAPMFAVGSIVVPLAVYLAMDPRPRSAKPPARSGSRPREAGLSADAIEPASSFVPLSVGRPKSSQGSFRTPRTIGGELRVPPDKVPTPLGRSASPVSGWDSTAALAASIATVSSAASAPVEANPTSGADALGERGAAAKSGVPSEPSAAADASLAAESSAPAETSVPAKPSTAADATKPAEPSAPADASAAAKPSTPSNANAFASESASSHEHVGGSTCTRALDSVPDPAPVPEAHAPRSLESSDCFKKARNLKMKGAHAVAARLFRESADRAPDEAQRRKAEFEELACYVLAGQHDRARALADELRVCGDHLTSAERIKLDAVARMI